MVGIGYELIHLYLSQKYLLLATSSWLLVTFCYIAWRFLQSGPRRIGKTEPCVKFLKREFEGKRQFARLTREWMLLLIPAVLGAWWGGGPALRAKEMGIRWVWLLQPRKPMQLLVILSVLVLVWLAMGNVVRKATREIERLGEH